MTRPLRQAGACIQELVQLSHREFEAGGEIQLGLNFGGNVPVLAHQDNRRSRRSKMPFGR